MNCLGGKMKGLMSLVRNLIVCSAACACLCAFTMAVDATVVDASVLNIRTETNTKCDVVTKVKSGTVLNVTGRLGDWYSVEYGSHAGFVSGDYLRFDKGVEVANTLGTVTGASVNVRNAPGTDNPVVTKLIKNTYVNVLAAEDGWYKISYKDYTGYIHADYLSVNGVVYTYNEDAEADYDIPDQADMVKVASELPSDTASVSVLRQSIVAYAKQYLGVKYVYGGATPDGFDCSGFTSYVFKHFGISLNRSSAGQASNGVKVSKSELLPGDLVLFSRGSKSVGHVGIYIGNGEFIHATSPGNVVSITPLDMDYYVERYAGARNVID